MLKSVKPKANKQPISLLVSEYNILREQKKTIEDRMKVLANDIKNYALNKGEKDDKGSFYCENSDFLFGAVARKSVKIDEDKLIEYLKSNGYTSAINVKTVEEVNEGELQKLVNSGKIEDSDIDTFTKVTTSYSVCCQSKEEVINTVEQKELPSAASEKPRNLKFRRR